MTNQAVVWDRRALWQGAYTFIKKNHISVNIARNVLNLVAISKFIFYGYTPKRNRISVNIARKVSYEGII